jgi:hypothetical protein
MRVPDKIALVHEIARHLNHLGYGYQAIDALLFGYKIPEPKGSSYNNTVDYTKDALFKCDNEIIAKIALDLDISAGEFENFSYQGPKNWKNTEKFRLFISHISSDKDKAKRLKDCLMPFHIDEFVAHEDIFPTASW